MTLRRLLVGFLAFCEFFGQLFGRFATAEELEKNTIGMVFVRLEPGVFTRGFLHESGGSEAFNLAHPFSNQQSTRAEEPPHKVEITRSFELSSREITVAQFRRFTDRTGYITEAERDGGAYGFFPKEKNYVDRFHRSSRITWKTPGFAQSDRHPVVCVSWNDAQAFCQWLSETEGTLHRLPTEAEWEYACRAGTETWYSWGNDPDNAYTHANVADGALEAAAPNTTRYQRAVQLKPEDGDGTVFTSSTASFKPNAWGLFDMHGNVWEWCQDRWSADLYRSYFEGVSYRDRKNVLIKDPLFLDKTDQDQYGDWRVIRGGAWTCAPAAVRSSIRAFAEAADASVYTGFRVVREVTRENADREE